MANASQSNRVVALRNEPAWSTSQSAGGANRVQAELGRALKEFFGFIKPVQSNLRSMTSAEPHGGDIEAVSRDLDTALATLKRSVASAVKTHKHDKKKDLSMV